MSIDHSILYQKIKKTLGRFQESADFDVDLVSWLIRKVIFHDPAKRCVMKGAKEDWQGLPESKSLFFAGANKGLPIGNLTSQLFGNIYLNDFDYFIKCKLGCKYYGRYVDDIVIIHSEKERLKSIVPVIKEYLQTRLFIYIHPRKIYLQHFSKGVPFLGTVIKPNRIYIGNRTKGNFYKKIREWNNFLVEKNGKLVKEDIKRFLASMNSYMGIMKHYHTYRLRRKMLARNLLLRFLNYANILYCSFKKGVRPQISKIVVSRRQRREGRDSRLHGNDQEAGNDPRFHGGRQGKRENAGMTNVGAGPR